MKSLSLLIFLLLCNSCQFYSEEKKHFNSSENIVLSDTQTFSRPLEDTVAKYRVQMQAKMDKLLGYSPKSMTKQRPDCALYDLTTAMVATFLADSFGISPDIVLLNHGGLRSSLAKGDVTLGNIFSLMPFDNTLTLSTISRDSLEQLLHHVVRRKGEPMRGIELTVVCDTLNNYTIVGGKSRNDTTFLLATSNYLANGGDKMSMLLDPLKQEEYSVLLRDIFVWYFKQGYTELPTPSNYWKTNLCKEDLL